MTISTTYPFTTPANYSYPATIEVTGGVAQLVLQNNPGQNFTETFATDTGFVYNASFTEFVAGVMRQIQNTYKGPYNEGTFYASFSSVVDGDYGFGVLTGTPVGGASISGNKLDLAYSDLRYVDYAGSGNVSMLIQQGCFRLKYTPNYSGSPAGSQAIFHIAQASASGNNQILLRHTIAGQLDLVISNSAGANIVNTALGAWAPVTGTEYEMELNFDVTTGATRLFVDGNQFGATQVGTGTRSTNIGLLRIGTGNTPGLVSNFSISDLIIFNSPQHTANYIPSAYPQQLNPTFYAGYENDVNGDWGNGVLTGTPSGGAAVSGGALDLNYGDIRYVEYAALNNIDDTEKGCIRIRVTPNYSGTPATVQSFIVVNDSGTSNNETIIFHQAGTGQLRFNFRDNTGTTRATGGAVWNPTSGNTYEIELNWDNVNGITKLFVDGVEHSSDLVNTTSRTAPDTITIGSNFDQTLTSNFGIEDLLLFDNPQHFSDYTPDWSEILAYEYYGDIITLPEMEYTGAGALVSFDAFPVTDTNSPRYTLQIGRSGNYLYWNGGAWAISNNTYAQANDAATFAANVGTLPVLGEIYCQFRVYTQNSIGTQQSVDEITASLTTEIYPTSDPIIQTGSIGVEELVSLVETVVKAGSDDVSYILTKGGVDYYHDGSSWTTSDGSYAQSNSAAEIVANVSTFTSTNVVVSIKAILHSATGVTTPQLDELTISYDYYAPSPTAPNECIVYGYAYDVEGDPIQYLDVYAELGSPAVYNGSITIYPFTRKAITDSSGYWEISLVETANMTGTVQYTFTFLNGSYRIIERKSVPDQATADYTTL